MNVAPPPLILTAQTGGVLRLTLNRPQARNALSSELMGAILATLEGAGMSRFQVLSAATRTPGEFMAKVKPAERRFGTVSVGARADLILSAANPLDDLATLQKPLGVAANGRWYDAAALQGLLDGVAAQYRAVAETR